MAFIRFRLKKLYTEKRRLFTKKSSYLSLKDTIDEILYNKKRILAIQEKKREGPNPNDDNFKEKYSTAPKLGTRVRRGPDWTQDNQDSEGPGTIVGHGDSGNNSESFSYKKISDFKIRVYPKEFFPLRWISVYTVGQRNTFAVWIWL